MASGVFRSEGGRRLFRIVLFRAQYVFNRKAFRAHRFIIVEKDVLKKKGFKMNKNLKLAKFLSYGGNGEGP